MNTTEMGNRLEDKLYEYLLEQKNHDKLVYDVYPATHCTVLKKQKYYCTDRKADVEFDVVVEVRRTGGEEPHSYLIFECKNHKNPVREKEVRNFSSQIDTCFGHNVKGIFITTNKLQSGAYKFAESKALGIAKFDENGIDFIADRKVGRS